MCTGIVDCALDNNRDILRKVWNGIIGTCVCNLICIFGSGLLLAMCMCVLSMLPYSQNQDGTDRFVKKIPKWLLAHLHGRTCQLIVR